MKHTLSLVMALTLLACGVASAQPAPVALTLEEALARAIDASHRLGEARAREQGAQAAIDVRRAAERPTVTLNGGYTRTNHVDEFGVAQPNGQLRVIYPDIPDNYFTRASFQWPIYTSGRLDALERAAEAEARALGAEVQVAQADLRLEVTRAYWALVTAEESVRVLEEALSRAEAHLRDVQAMFDTGLVPPSDVALVESQRSRQRMQLIEAQNIRRGVAEDLKRLTGLSPDVDLRPSTAPPSPLRTSPPSLAPSSRASFGEAGAAPELVSTALRQRGERQALAERILAAGDREVAAAAGRKPTIALAGGVDYANPNPRIFPRLDKWRESWDLTMNVSVPLWDAGRSKAETAEAAAAARALRERLADLDALIALDVRQRQLDIDSADAAIAAAEDAVRSAQEARRVVAERFRVGVATSTDMLDAQVALLQAELDRTRSLANLRLAQARLDRAVGR
jgi:outer membrane protein TolC